MTRLRRDFNCDAHCDTRSRFRRARLVFEGRLEIGVGAALRHRRAGCSRAGGCSGAGTCRENQCAAKAQLRIRKSLRHERRAKQAIWSASRSATDATGAVFARSRPFRRLTSRRGALPKGTLGGRFHLLFAARPRAREADRRSADLARLLDLVGQAFARGASVRRRNRAPARWRACGADGVEPNARNSTWVYAESAPRARRQEVPADELRLDNVQLPLPFDALHVADMTGAGEWGVLEDSLSQLVRNARGRDLRAHSRHRSARDAGAGGRAETAHHRDQRDARCVRRRGVGDVQRRDVAGAIADRAGRHDGRRGRVRSALRAAPVHRNARGRLVHGGFDPRTFVSGTRQVLAAQLVVSVGAVALAGWTLGVTNELIRERDRLKDRVVQLEQTLAASDIVVPPTAEVVNPAPTQDAYPPSVTLPEETAPETPTEPQQQAENDTPPPSRRRPLSRPIRHRRPPIRRAGPSTPGRFSANCSRPRRPCAPWCCTRARRAMRAWRSVSRTS